MPPPPPDPVSATGAGLPESIRAAMADPARRVGRYVVLSELGRGGMGVVCRAFDPQLRREVALKMLIAAPGPGVERQVERLIREARAAARLQHRAIVSVHEVGDHQGRPFLVMDLVESRTLDEIVAERALRPRVAAELVAEIADALAHAHDQGILHRDVKPQNVLVDAEGRPHLTDFGLALEIGGKDRLTQTGQLVGTPLYISPEQARGDRDAVGPLSDVYSLGGVLYFALTRRPPVAGDTLVSVIHSVLHEEPEPPRTIDATVHPDIERIVLKCLEKEPAGRYASAAELRDDIRRFLDGQAIHARPLGRGERVGRWVRRNRALALTVAGATALLLALGLALVVREVRATGAIRAALEVAEREREVATARQRDAERERERAVDESRRAREAEEEAQLARERSERLLARALIEKAERLRADRRHGEAAALFAGYLAHAESVEARGGLALALSQMARLEWSTRRHLPAGPVAIDPEALLLAVTDVRRSTVRIVDLESGEAVAVLALPSVVDGLAIAPDRSRLGTGGEVVRLWDVASSTEMARFEPPELGSSRLIGFSLDGASFVTASRTVVRRHDASTAEVTAERPLRGGDVAPWSRLGPDGRVAVVGADGLVRILAFGQEDDEDLVLEATSPYEARSCAWGADGARLAVATADGSLLVFETDRGAPVATCALPGVPASVAFPPGEGRGCYVLAADGGLALIDVRTGDELGRLREPTGASGWLGVAERAGRVVAADPALGIDLWDAGTGEPVLRSEGESIAAPVVGWTADGRRVVAIAGAEADRVTIRDAASGEEIGHVELRGGVAAASWSAAAGRLGLAFVDAGAIRVGFVDVDAADRALRVVDAELPGSKADGLALDPAGRRAAVVVDGRLRVISLDSGELLAEPKQDDGELLVLGVVTWSPDGRSVLDVPRAGDGYEKVVRWNAETGARSGRFGAWQLGRHTALAIEPAGDRLVATSTRDFRTYTLEANKDEGEVVRGHEGRIVNDVAWRQDGSRFATAGDDGAVRIWDPDGHPVETVIRFESAARRVAWSPDGRRLATVSDDGVLRVWRLGDGLAPVAQRVAGYSEVAFGPDGRVAIHGWGNGYILDPVSGEEVGHVDEVAPGVALGLEWTDDGRLVGYGETVRFGDPDTGEIVRELVRPDGSRGRVFVSPDGGALAFLDGSGVGMLELDDAEATPRVVPLEAPRTLAWDASSAWLAVVWQGGIALVPRAAGGEVRRLEITTSGEARWSRDGRFLALGGGFAGTAVAIVELERGEVAAVLRGHRARVTAVDWSDDGEHLVTASHDGTVRVWRRSGVAVAALGYHGGPVYDAAWSRDGRFIASVARDPGHAHVLDVARMGLLEPAAAIAARIWRQAELRAQGLDAVPVVRDRLTSAGD